MGSCIHVNKSFEVQIEPQPKHIISSKSICKLIMESCYQVSKHLSTRITLVKDESSSSTRSTPFEDLLTNKQHNKSDSSFKYFLKFLSSKEGSLDERLKCQECWRQ